MSNLWINKFETKGVEYDIHAANEDELQKKLIAGDNIEIDPDTNEISSTVSVASTDEPGIVKPDGTTITVDDDGTIHAVSSGDGVTTYNQLSGKPRINGEELIGNKSSSTLGLAEKNVVDNHINDDTIHVTGDDKSNWDNKADQAVVTGIATSVSNHTSNHDIHVTAQDKTNWNNKASASSVNTLSDSLDNHVENSTIHVTSEDKELWNNKSDFSGRYNDLSNKPVIPSQLSQLTSDTSHRTITDTERNAWNNKSDFSGSYNDLENKPDIPESLADLPGDSTHRTVTDAEKTEWNSKSDFSGSYNDLSNKPTIPDELSDLATDENHRLVTDSEKALWNAKSDFSGNYNDLNNKPTIPTQLSQLTGDSTHRVITDSERTAWNAKQNALPTAVVDKYLHVNALTGQLEWSDSNGGSVVEWNQLVSEGTKIAQLTIDGVPTDIYAPTSGGGSGATSLGQLDDVALSGLSDGQIFAYNNTTHKWQNKTFDSVVANPVVSGLETELEAIKISGTKYIIPKGSEVEFQQVIQSGTKIATITIDGSFYDIYVPDIPTSLSDLTSDANHRVVTDAEKSTWNAKSNFSGSYNDLSNKPTIPTELSDLSSDSTHRLVTDAEKSAWNAKASTDTATTSSDGLMSSEDKSKLNSIEDDAQANVLEGVQINGTDLDISNKKVNVPIATTSNLGVIKPDGTTTTIDENGIIHSVGSHSYTSLERYRSYSYKITFDELPERIVGGSSNVSGCSSFVSSGKVYRNLDWNYNNGCAFNVITKEFKGMAHSDTLTDGNFTDEELGQLPYQIVDGRNDYGIIVTTHVVHNDWEWTGSGDTETGLVPYLILTNVHDINDLSTYVSSIVSSLKVPERLANLEYVHQFLISDGTTTYALLPPTVASGNYSLVDISAVPKLANFRWINKATIASRSDSDLQLHPNGIERWNLMPCSTKDIRFTKAYESTAWLSEFIGEGNTTKNSTDAELESIYNIAHEAYLDRTREDEIPTWQTMYSVVYSDKGIEELYFQEDFDTNYAINNIWISGLGDTSAQMSGTGSSAFGDYSVAEGSGTKAYGEGSHAEGIGTVARGIASHVEGQQTSTIGDISHAEGGATTAGGDYSHAEGNSTVTNNSYEHAEGHFNVSHKAVDTYGNGGNTIHSVGIGTGLQNKKNAIEIMQNGNEYLYGVGNYDGANIDNATTLQDIINSKADSSDIPTSLSELADDSTHRVVTDTEKSTWNSKSGSTASIENKKLKFTNGSGSTIIDDSAPSTTKTYSSSKIESLISGGGTNVVANPMLDGTEPALTGLEVNGDKYKIPQNSTGVWTEGNTIFVATLEDGDDIAYGSGTLVVAGLMDTKVLPDKHNTGCHGTLVSASEEFGWTAPSGNLSYIEQSFVTSYGNVIENIDFSGYCCYFPSSKTYDIERFIFKNCKFDGVVNGEITFNFGIQNQSSSLIVECWNCTFEHFKSSATNAVRTEMHKCFIDKMTDDGFKVTDSSPIYDCFVKGIGTNIAAHADGVQCLIGDNIIIDNYRSDSIALKNINVANAAMMLSNDTSGGSLSNCYVIGGDQSTIHFNEGLLQTNIQVGCAYGGSHWYYDNGEDESRYYDFNETKQASTAWVSSVWKEADGIHFLATNYTNQQRNIVIRTNNGTYTKTIDKCPTWNEYRDTYTSLDDFPFDVEYVVPLADWFIAYDTNATTENQIRFVNYTEHNIYI